MRTFFGFLYWLRPLYLSPAEKPRVFSSSGLTNRGNVLNCDSSIIHILQMNAPERSELSHLTLDDLAKLGVPGLISNYLLIKIVTPEGTEDSDPCPQYSIKELLDFLIIQIKTGSLSSGEFSNLCEALSILKSENNAKLLLYEAEVEIIMSLNAVSAEPAPAEVVEKPESKKKPWDKHRGLVLGAALTAFTAADYGRQLNDTDFDQRIAFETRLEIIKLIQSDKITINEDYECQQQAERSLWLTAYHPFDAAVILPYYLAHKIDGKSHNLFPLSQIAYPREKKLFYERTKAEWACDQATIKKNAEAIKPEK